jgi:hypothetical protein
LQGAFFHFFLGIYEGDDAATTSEDELRLVREDDLDHLVAVSQEDGFSSSFPLLDVADVV